MLRKSLAACSSTALLFLQIGASQADTLPPLPASIEASKVLRVASSMGAPGLDMLDPKTGEFVGFDVELLAAMAKIYGLKVEYHDGKFEQMMPSLQSGRVDLILSALYDTPKRRAQFDFIDYLKAGAQFYTVETNTELKEAIDLCGKAVSVDRGTSYPDTVKAWSDKNCVGAGKPEVNIVLDSEFSQQIINIKTGRADAAVQGLEILGGILEAEPGVYKSVGDPISSALMGAAFNKGDPTLRDAMHFAMKQLVADGTYDALITKWKLGPSSYKELTINAGPQP